MQEYIVGAVFFTAAACLILAAVLSMLYDHGEQVGREDANVKNGLAKAYRHGISEHKTVTTKPDGTVVEEYAYLSLNIPEKV